MTKIKSPTTVREYFLRALESAQSGLAQRETVEQSTCYIFDKGQVIAFNEEVCVRGPSCLPENITGAVNGAKLLDALRKMSGDEIEVTQGKGRIDFRDSRERYWVRTESEISLPYHVVEQPKDWFLLPDEFSEVVQTVAPCASKDTSQGFVWGCFNVTPDCIEAAEDTRCCRWQLNTGFKRPVILKREAGNAITRTAPTHAALGKNWVHFKNAREFILSVRRYEDEYNSSVLDRWLGEEGQKVTLPKGLKECCEKARVFTQDNGDVELVRVSLSANKVRIEGEGPLGGYRSNAPAEWSGPDVKFFVSPQILAELVEKYDEVTVTQNTLKIQGQHYTYCTRLNVVEDKEEDQ